LIATIDAAEKRLFDAIDGSDTIGTIVERAWPESRTDKASTIARAFFERLWWYDQVVFDTSQPICRTGPRNHVGSL